MDGHPQSVHWIRSCQGYIATGMVMGAILRAPYKHLVRATVASPSTGTDLAASGALPNEPVSKLSNSTNAIDSS
jgi:hypothetical protein